MGLIGWTIGLPLQPVRGVIWLGGLIQQRVEHELHDPGVARRQLEEADRAARSGDLPPETQAEVERQVTERLAGTTGAGGAPEVEA